MPVDKDRISRRLASITAARPVDAPPPPPSKKPKRVQRADDRRPAFKFGKVVLDDKSELKCVIKDLSAAGAKIVLEGAITLPPIVLLKIDQTGERRKAAVVWQKETDVGLSFSARRL